MVLVGILSVFSAPRVYGTQKGTTILIATHIVPRLVSLWVSERAPGGCYAELQDCLKDQVNTRILDCGSMAVEKRSSRNNGLQDSYLYVAFVANRIWRMHCKVNATVKSSRIPQAQTSGRSKGSSKPPPSPTCSQNDLKMLPK